MSEDKNKLDELFRNQFENVELPVSDKLLQNIKRDLDIPEQNRRGGFWLLWLLGVLLVLVSIGAYWFVGSTAKETTNTAINLNSEKNTKVEETKQLAENLSNKESEALKESKAVEKSNHEAVEEKTLESKASTEKAEAKKTIVVSKEVASQSKTVESKTKPNASKRNPKNTISVVIAEERSEKKSKREKKSSSAKPQLDKPSIENKSAVVKKNKEKNTHTKKSEEVKLENKSKNLLASSQLKSSKDAEKSTILDAAEKVNDEVNKTNTSTAVEKNGDNKNTSVTESAANKAEEKPIEEVVKKDSMIGVANKKPAVDSSVSAKNITDAKEEKAQKKVSLFVDAGAGPSLAFRSLSANQSLTASERNKYENNLLTYNAGIDVGMLLKEKFVVSVGLGIENKGEKYSYPGRDAVNVTAYDTSYSYHDTTYFVDSVMYTDTIIDSSIVAHELQLHPATASKEGHNTYQYFRLPIMFGYKFTITDNWFVTANVGIVLNYLYKVNVFWENASGESVYYTKTNGVYNSTSIAARLKLDVGYDLSEHWSVLVQPGYTRFVQSIYRKEQSFKQYPYSYDLNIAVRYKF